MDEMHNFFKDLPLKVENIFIQNRKVLSQKAILKILEPDLESSILCINIENLRNKLIKTNLFDQVIVKRILPNDIYIYVEEKVPFGIWNNKGKKFIVDTKGDVIVEVEEAKKDKDLNVYLKEKLINLFGVNSNVYGFDFIQKLKNYKSINKSLISLIRIDDKRWDIVLPSKTVIKLPEKITDEILNIIEKFIIQNETNIEKFEILDLRNSKKVYIKKRN